MQINKIKDLQIISISLSLHIIVLLLIISLIKFFIVFQNHYAE